MSTPRIHQQTIKYSDFHEFLNNMLINLNDKIHPLEPKNAFISYLDEAKIEERFDIIASTGRFQGSDGVNLITSVEIDILSIAYMSKMSFQKNNIYVDVIEQNNKIIFVYLEFDLHLTKQNKIEIDVFFKSLNEVIISKLGE